MEIQVDGETVADVEGTIRSVSLRSNAGELTSVPVAPGIRLLNLVMERPVEAHAPRLDEIEEITNRAKMRKPEPDSEPANDTDADQSQSGLDFGDKDKDEK